MIDLTLIGLALDVIGVVVLAVGGDAFLSKEAIADRGVLRVPTSSTEGPPTTADYLKTPEAKRLLKARRFGLVGVSLLIIGILFQVAGQIW